MKYQRDIKNIFGIRTPENGVYSDFHRDMGSLSFAVPMWTLRRQTRGEWSIKALYSGTTTGQKYKINFLHHYQGLGQSKQFSQEAHRPM